MKVLAIIWLDSAPPLCLSTQAALNQLNPSVALYILHNVGSGTFPPDMERMKKLHPRIIFAVLAPHIIRNARKRVFDNKTLETYRSVGSPLMWFLDAMPWAPVLGLREDSSPRLPCSRMAYRSRKLDAACLNDFVVNGAHERRAKNLMPLWHGLAALPEDERADSRVRVR